MSDHEGSSPRRQAGRRPTRTIKAAIRSGLRRHCDQRPPVGGRILVFGLGGLAATIDFAAAVVDRRPAGRQRQRQEGAAPRRRHGQRNPGQGRRHGKGRRTPRPPRSDAWPPPTAGSSPRASDEVACPEGAPRGRALGATHARLSRRRFDRPRRPARGRGNHRHRDQRLRGRCRGPRRPEGPACARRSTSSSSSS